MIIRQAKKSDKKEVIKLHIKLARSSMKFDKLIIPTRIGCNILNDFEKNDAIILVAEDKGKLIGFAYGTIKKVKHLSIGRMGHFNDCYIEKAYRRKGIARKLTKQLMNWYKIKKIKYVDVYVDSKNTTGLKTWTCLGFRETDKCMRRKL